MRIGEVIRERRLRAGLTQAEMARRLGVTAPAVNKWERGRALPDVALLAPIARLLDVSLDALLSFEAALSPEALETFMRILDSALRERPFSEAFDMARRELAVYPNSEPLLLNVCLLLDAWGVMGEEPPGADVEAFLQEGFERLLESREPKIRRQAAEGLYNRHLRAGRYAEAEACLAHFPEDAPDRKLKQAALYAEMDRGEDAARACAEVLFDSYAVASAAMHGRYMQVMRAGDRKEARAWADRLSALAGLFEMGEYHAAAPYLELATEARDAEATLDIVGRLLRGVGSLTAFREAPMYRGMRFRAPDAGHYARLRRDLLEGFRDPETYGYMAADPRWQALLDAAEADGAERPETGA